MEKEQKHTPTPWSVEYDELKSFEKSDVAYPWAIYGPAVRYRLKGMTSSPCIAFVNERKDADFIVEACNNYTALKEENQKLRAAVSAYRESLRKKVTEWHDIAEKNKNDSIAAEEVAVATYWDGNQDAMANVLSLLGSPETTQL